ncbi:hypothetical protein K443DRAFT_673121 [Laccaria amethystina LaAM-08-1]|uniref:Integral membrane protein n=1 Tax=Laccaria amethystina LaAM-08-1 TaxID=1095629 RepID=A0A0C9YIH7_9AGAR|nr:hypothetical protein K443DRAFT_673121 [Laccaria amethystina LaAM-08-1]
MSPGKTTPPWPSLYNPGLEILHIEHRPPTQKGAEYLYSASDIFRFTLYWNLIFYTPLFLVCGLYAFWNYSFPPSPRPSQHPPFQDTLYPLTPLSSALTSRTPGNTPLTTYKKNERRSRLAFALLVLLTFMTLSVAGAVIGAAVLGFVAMGLFRAGNFNMSTWIPFLLAVIQVFVGLLSVWPSIIEII